MSKLTYISTPAVVKDAYMDSYTGRSTNNYGGSTGIQFYWGNGIIAFDWGAMGVPSDATVTDYSLSLYVSQNSNATQRTLTLNRVLRDWGEGTQNGAAAQTGDCCATYAKSTSVAWTAGCASSSGNDYSATTSFSGNCPTTASVWHTGITSAQMQTDIQNWISGTNQNYGWVMRWSGSYSGTYYAYASSDTADTNLRPKIVITFTSSMVAEPSITASTTDNTVRAYHGTWATCRGNPSTLLVSLGTASDATYSVSSTYTGGNYYIWRAWLPFDTSVIPAGATILQVLFSMTASSYAGSGDAVSLVTTTNTSLSTSSFNIANWGSTALCTFPAQPSGKYTYDLTGAITLNLGGMTYLGLRGAKDMANSAPADASNTSTWVTGDGAAGSKPTISVTYLTAGGTIIYRTIRMKNNIKMIRG